MMTDRLLIWLALMFYAGAGILTVYRLRRLGEASSLHHLNVVLIVAGFALHTAGLFLRGEHLQRCPLTNLFEAQVFIAWAAVLFYLLIGLSYRVSFLGAFTAPLVSAIVLTALLAPVDVAGREPLKHSGWVEFHAAIGIVSFGAFALSAVMGAMYLSQERQLKSRHPGATLWLLPSVDQLDVIGFRLLVLGFALLTVGMLGGAVSNRLVENPWPWPKIVWAVWTWLIYAGLLGVRLTGAWRGHKAAEGAVAAFVLTLTAYWGASWLAP